MFLSGFEPLALSLIHISIEQEDAQRGENLISFALDLLGKSKNLEDAVSLLFARIGKIYHMDRVSLLEIDPSFLSCRFTYQWLNEMSYICLLYTSWRRCPLDLAFYSIASVGHPPIQAMQWVQRPFHTGFPPSIDMLFSGHRRAHFPQEIHLSETVKPCLLYTSRCV